MPVPPQVPLIKFFSGEKSDQGLIEYWSAETASYKPLDLGAVHPNVREYPGFKLVKQQNVPNDQRFVIRIWAKDDTNPNWFAYAIKYLAESKDHPIFIRQTRELRKTYTPKTKLQPLDSVYQIKRATAGSGYTPGTFPAITGAGGAGSGVSGYGIVAPDGTIADFVLDSGGTGYTSAPTLTVAAPPAGGMTATATAVVQPQTALLVGEEAQEFPPDSEFNFLYLNVSRVYQTLPGPVLNGQEWDFKWGFPRPFSVQEQAAGTGGPGEISIVSSVVERSKTIDYTTAIDALLGIIIITPGTLQRIDLPDVLESITLFYEFAKGGGDYREDGLTEGPSQLGRSMTAAGHSQGSASVLPSPIVNIKSTTARNIAVQQCVFFMVLPVSDAQVRGTLATLITAGTTVTITIASPGVVTWTAHGLSDGDTVALSTSGALPTGLTAATIYYVINSATNTFQLSLTSGGAAINTSGSQSGVHKGHVGVTSWQQFDPQEHQIVVTGKHLTLSVDTKAHVATDSLTVSEITKSSAVGYSTETGSVIRETHIAPTIHGVITIAIDGDAPTLEPIEVASRAAVVSDANVWSPNVTAEISRSDSVGFTVRPYILPATQLTAIPTKGFHISHSEGEPYLSAPFNGSIARIAMIRADVVNMADVLLGSSSAGTGSVGTPVVGITAATSPSSGTVALTGYVVPNASSTLYSWEYGLTPAYGSTSSGATISTTLYTKQVVTKTISGLVSGSDYHFRLKGVNTLGTTYSADKKVTVT